MEVGRALDDFLPRHVELDLVDARRLTHDQVSTLLHCMDLEQWSP